MSVGPDARRRVLAMDPALVSAHQALDRLVDRAFGAPRGTKTEADRQAVLFDGFADLTRGAEQDVDDC